MLSRVPGRAFYHARPSFLTPPTTSTRTLQMMMIYFHLIDTDDILLSTSAPPMCKKIASMNSVNFCSRFEKIKQ